MIEFLKQALSSGDGASAKRLITFLFALVIIVIALVDQFAHKIISEFVFNGLVTIELIGLGSVASEVIGKFSKSPTPPKD
jgi:hypothetical protein